MKNFVNTLKPRRIMQSKFLILNAALILLCGCAGETDTAGQSDAAPAYAAATGGEINPKAVPIADYQEAIELFAQLNYTPEEWQAGIRLVPRLYLSEISEQWSKVTTKEIDVALKKQLFFRALGPLALRSNELILQDRDRLEKIIATGNYSTDKGWLLNLAELYRLPEQNFADNAARADELLLRVDIVPASLVLAQAAEESGWGTSRFAFSGNALFGQWTWGETGMRPEQQREHKGDYRIAVFDSPLESVQAHALNLNTHNAYRDFRHHRAKLRHQGARISGLALTSHLTNYSERGGDYIKSLNSIINFNKLDPADDAFLGDNRPLVMVRPKTVGE
jgi:Bax protein